MTLNMLNDSLTTSARNAERSCGKRCPPLGYADHRCFMHVASLLMTDVAEEVPRRRSRRFTVTGIITVVALLAGLLTVVIVNRSQSSDDTFPVPELTWEPVEGGLEQTRLAAPVDYDDPDGATLEVYLLRRPAGDPATRIGSLLVNPGGPGFGGSTLALNAETIYDQAVLDRFDIVGFDPRGTGQSLPAVDCIDNYDELFSFADASPADEAARQQQRDRDRAYAEACVARTGDAVAALHTANVARDMDLIRRALGEDTMTYFGTSYGCELGAVWATMFADTVRAAVLDACADPNADVSEGARQQAQGFQSSIEAFLAQCVEIGSECPIFNDGDPEAVYLAVREMAATEGIPSLAGRPLVNETFFSYAVVTAMYSAEAWPTLAFGLASALEGDASVLTQLTDAYTQRAEDGTWGNPLEAFSVISCLDADSIPTPAEEDALARDLVTLAPLLYTEGAWTALPCALLPAATEPPVTVTGGGASPLLVMGSTGDPATPLASTEAMAAALEGSVMVVVDSNQHGSYGLNDCINDIVHRTLFDQVLPAPGQRC